MDLAINTDELQEALMPIRRTSPRLKLGKRMRTSQETIEVPATQDFRVEIGPYSFNSTQKEELLEENRKLRLSIIEKEEQIGNL